MGGVTRDKLEKRKLLRRGWREACPYCGQLVWSVASHMFVCSRIQPEADQDYLGVCGGFEKVLKELADAE